MRCVEDIFRCPCTHNPFLSYLFYFTNVHQIKVKGLVPSLKFPPTLGASTLSHKGQLWKSCSMRRSYQNNSGSKRLHFSRHKVSPMLHLRLDMLSSSCNCTLLYVHMRMFACGRVYDRLVLSALTWWNKPSLWHRLCPLMDLHRHGRKATITRHSSVVVAGTRGGHKQQRPFVIPVRPTCLFFCFFTPVMPFPAHLIPPLRRRHLSLLSSVPASSWNTHWSPGGFG